MNLPDFAMRCGFPPEEYRVRARLEALGLLVKCRRCKGTGKYEGNPQDDRCYGCLGARMKLPPLTARLAADVRKMVEEGKLEAFYQENRARMLRRSG